MSHRVRHGRVRNRFDNAFLDVTGNETGNGKLETCNDFPDADSDTDAD
jgi:hypothetical protein